MLLDGKVAIVTGAGRGIGRAYALRLAREGARVVVAEVLAENGEETAAAVRAAGGEALAVPNDVADEASTVAMARAAADAFGRLDVLVNNAGVGIGGTIEGYSTKYLDMQLGVNLRSYIIAVREAVPMLKEAGAEHGKALVVNTASIAGKSGQLWLSVYSATKFGVVGFSQAMQKELGAHGVQVTALCPGFVDTDMTEWARGQVKREEMIRPEDIAEAVRFLLRTSRNCVVPEVVFARPSEQLEALP